MNDDVLSKIANEEITNESLSAGRQLAADIDVDTNVGDLLKISFGEGQVIVHDHQRQKVRGLPHGSFLVATRMGLGETDENDAEDEDTCLILLRIIDVSSLPNEKEMELFRFQAGMRSVDSTDTWDAPSKLDEWTKHNLSFGGFKCRVLGTFRMKRDENNNYHLAFGADLINFYSGLGMKVYKPTGRLLEKIVNFRRPLNLKTEMSDARVRVGRVRYASSEIGVNESSDNVPVEIDPLDLIARRTFYGGMSRGGKSNAMKIAARAIYRLRIADANFRVGQLIFDPNGEYANENAQDGGSLKNAYTALKGAEYSDEVETYGLNEHPNDPHRKIVKINFFGNEPSNWRDADDVSKSLDQLFVGKRIIDNELPDPSIYLKRFRDTLIEPPKPFESDGDSVRFRRFICIYQGILFAAGFEPPQPQVRISGLFSKDLRAAMQANTCSVAQTQSRIASAGEILGNEAPRWGDFVEACKGLRLFIKDGGGDYIAFENKYSKGKEGRRWVDDRITDILEVYAYPNGVAQFRRAERQHSSTAASDYAEDIVQALRNGKLVIFDQSTGDPQQNLNAAERILWQIFNRQKDDFVNPAMGEDGEITPSPPIMVYLEEAHNLLPAGGSNEDLKSIWARTAKEGSKYRIGMVLATQEPSTVMPAILKNTDNWFVAHLNNTDEVKALSKFYDFEDYAHQIKTITDPGFVRMRTLSNPFTIPVQIDLFQADEST